MVENIRMRHDIFNQEAPYLPLWYHFSSTKYMQA